MWRGSLRESTTHDRTTKVSPRTSYHGSGPVFRWESGHYRRCYPPRPSELKFGALFRKGTVRIAKTGSGEIAFVLAPGRENRQAVEQAVRRRRICGAGRNSSYQLDCRRGARCSRATDHSLIESEHLLSEENRLRSSTMRWRDERRRTDQLPITFTFMSRTRSFAASRDKPDPVLAIAKRTTPASFLLPLLGTGFSYLVCADELAMSTGAWIVGAIVTLLCGCGPFIVALAYRGTNSLRAFGFVSTLGILAASYFFGVVYFFYYFLFSPMPSGFRWPGLLGGLTLTAYWMVVAYMRVQHTITKSLFVAQVFFDEGDRYVYDVQRAARLYERFNKEPSPFPRALMYLVMAIAPFYLILGRVLSTAFCGNGVLFFLAVPGMPLSLWLAGLLVRTYLLTIALPRKLERTHRRPVEVSF